MQPLALIVEDDPSQAEIFQRALQAAGYQTLLQQNGQDALNYLQQHQPDLVVLDLHLPGLGGEKIVQMMRDMAHLAHTRLVLATADDRLAETLQPFCDLVLLKPISYTQLRDLTARLKPSSA